MSADREQPTDWPRLLAWFEWVAEAAPEQRADLLEAAEREQAGLRARVLRLLALDASTRDPGAAAAGWRQRLLADEPLPERVGPWRIVRELGAGGMGRVFLAERADGGYEQRVALKVVAGTAPSEVGVAHFLRERRILARLEHPGVTRLIDGGIGDDGQPWFAMEYVEGQPLPAYCDAEGLGLEARLRLFVMICDAVAYAHRQLVVHCDLKPGNILVDADGQPRLLDFGIAHLLRGPDGDGSTTTLLGRRLTPGYAAPEQLAGEPVSVATDVYALGVLLYELLTGMRPYAGRDQTPAAAIQAQTTGEPPPPSRARAKQPPVPGKRLRGDLDLIVATALRHDAAQRYAGADALAADLRRHLTGLPLRAHAPSRRYRGGRFVRRHRVGLALTALLVLVCAAGAVGIVHEAARARAQAERATAVKNFLVDVFNNADPDRHPGKDISARELLEAAAKRLQHDTNTPALVAAELADTLAQNFGAIGASDQAMASAKRALALHARISGPHSPGAARARIRYAQWLLKNAQGGPGAIQVHTALTDLGDEVSADTVHAHLLLAATAHGRGKFKAYVIELNQALALAKRLPPGMAYWRGKAQYSHAMALMAQSKFSASAAALATAAAQFKGVQSLADARKAQYMRAVLLMHTGHANQAVMQLGELAKSERSILGDSHPQLAQTLLVKAEALVLIHRYLDAKRAALESVAVEKRSGERGRNYVNRLNGSVIVVMAQGDLLAARRLAAQVAKVSRSQPPGARSAVNAMAFDAVRSSRGEPGRVVALSKAYQALPDHGAPSNMLSNLASSIGRGYLAVGDLADARAWCTRVAQANPLGGGHKWVDNPLALAEVQALVALQSGDTKLARVRIDHAMAVSKSTEILERDTAFFHLLHGLVKTRAGQPKAGMADIEPVLAKMIHNRGEHSAWTAEAHLAHAEAWAALGKHKQAAAESASAWAVLQRMLDPNHVELRTHRVAPTGWH